jgi:hypothetical protein
MDRRLVSGTVAALAAVVLATGGGTVAAFDDAADIPQSSAGAGILQLDLDSTGHASSAVSFTDLMPGVRTTTRVWVAANDAGSSVPATLTMTVHHLVDVPGRCDVSRGKADGEVTSGISGCVISGDDISGRPAFGTASRMLDVSASYAPVAVDPASCAAQAGGSGSLLPTTGPGDLYAAATANDGAGTTVGVVDAGGHPILIAPGRGVCLALRAYWPPNVTDAADASPDHPVDNAAQGDSFSVDVRFDLVQVAP